MAALGLGLSGLSEALGSGTTAVVIEDYMWEIHTTAGAGNLTPLLRGTASDFHDTWDLISISDGLVDYQPQTTATVSDEGYWDIGNAVSATDTDYIRPLDV